MDEAMANKSCSNVETLAISSIEVSEDLQSRAGLNERSLYKYCEAMRDKKKFPPLTVFRDTEGINWLADGHHRIAAAKEAGEKEIEAEIIEGSRHDAKQYALSANTLHGLPRTNADKRRAITMALEDEEWRKLSNVKIAEMCAVRESFVRKVKKELNSHNANSGSQKPKPKNIISQCNSFITFLEKIEEFSDEATSDEEKTILDSFSSISSILEGLKKQNSKAPNIEVQDVEAQYDEAQDDEAQGANLNDANIEI